MKTYALMGFIFLVLMTTHRAVEIENTARTLCGYIRFDHHSSSLCSSKFAQKYRDARECIRIPSWANSQCSVVVLGTDMMFPIRWQPEGKATVTFDSLDCGGEWSVCTAKGVTRLTLDSDEPDARNFFFLDMPPPDFEEPDPQKDREVMLQALRSLGLNSTKGARPLQSIDPCTGTPR